MFKSDQKLKHLPFFEELAVHDEGSAEWRAASAGLLVLRFVDSWLEESRGVCADDSWQGRRVEAAVLEVDDGWPGRVLLTRVLDATRDPRADINAVVVPLMAYAQVLEYDARWALASDVYHTLLAHLHPLKDSDSSIAAHLRLAHCYRTLNLNDDAAKTYAAAGEIATRSGDLVGVLRARIGEGRIAMFAGNLPRAELILDEAISRAKRADLGEVRSRALHVRGNVAHFRGQYELAIQFAYEALENTPNNFERDRILSDIAVSFLELGVYSAARDAYLVLSVTAQEQYIRWAATLNLLEIATRTGAEPLFERYRRELVDIELPPYLATARALNVGLGYQRFGDNAKARGSLTEAIALAGKHGFNQYLFEAEEALDNLERPVTAQRTHSDLSLQVQEVVGAIEKLKKLAGVG